MSNRTWRRSRRTSRKAARRSRRPGRPPPRRPRPPSRLPLRPQVSRKVMERSEAMSLATLISDVDSEGRREMAKFLAGGIGVEDFVPYFRRQVARQLAGDRLKPKQRMRLQEWAVRYGLKMMAGEEPRTIRVEMFLSTAGMD